MSAMSDTAATSVVCNGLQRATVTAGDILPGLLESAVRLRIMELKELDEMVYRAVWRAWVDEGAIDASGLWNESILFVGGKGETAIAFNAMAKAVAALAFVPGGVRVFNQWYEAKRP